MDSSAIQVSIYDDRLEVDSPGMLYDGLNVSEAFRESRSAEIGLLRKLSSI